jgi:hypothetical protein
VVRDGWREGGVLKRNVKRARGWSRVVGVMVVTAVFASLVVVGAQVADVAVARSALASEVAPATDAAAASMLCNGDQMSSSALQGDFYANVLLPVSGSSMSFTFTVDSMSQQIQYGGFGLSLFLQTTSGGPAANLPSWSPQSPGPGLTKSTTVSTDVGPGVFRLKVHPENIGAASGS